MAAGKIRLETPSFVQCSAEWEKHELLGAFFSRPQPGQGDYWPTPHLPKAYGIWQDKR